MIRIEKPPHLDDDTCWRRTIVIDPAAVLAAFVVAISLILGVLMGIILNDH